MGWVNCLGESQSRVYPNMAYVCQIWLRTDNRVEWGGGGGADRQTDRPADKGTLQLYIVDLHVDETNVVLLWPILASTTDSNLLK